MNGERLVLFDLLIGTVQDLILGPVLYVLFVSPVPRWNKSLQELINDVEKSLESITKRTQASFIENI
jgi:hypothetical protein